MNAKIEQVKQTVAILRALVPGQSFELKVREDCVRLCYFDPKDHSEAIEIFRTLDIGQRTIGERNENYHEIRATVEGVTVEAYPNGLPPACRKVTYTERVPKTQTVDTGEFVEIERTKIVCDGDADKGQ